MTAIVDAYDAVYFDLDGVLYLGPYAVEGSVEGVNALSQRGLRTVYVTNNAARPPQEVGAHLAELGFPVGDDDIITSAQAAARLMKEELPAGAKVLVAGTQNLVDHMIDAGFTIVTTAEEVPDAVVQGYDPQMTWPRLDEASISVQRGAKWYACNTDTTRPTVRGNVPGAGAAVHAVHLTSGKFPKVTGKPYRPMILEALLRTGAKRPVFVGDRIDTDIAGANATGIDSCLVFTGVHGKRDLLTAEADRRPTHIAWDIPGMLRPVRVLADEGTAVRCGDAVASVVDGVAHLSGDLSTRDAQLDALWALAHLVWDERATEYEDALAVLNTVQ